MPPRKRARVSESATPLHETQPKTPADTSAATPAGDKSVEKDADQTAEDILKDPWTDEQETWLFKSMIRWKPTGIHKHFRMIAISQSLRSHGHNTQHTRIPGVWAKLNALYDLEALDERENNHIFADQPDPTEPEEADEMPEFELPDDEYGEMMWQRRFPDSEDEGSASPPLFPSLLARKGDPAPVPLSRSHTVEEAEGQGAKASPAARGRGGARGGRGAAASGRGLRAGKISQVGRGSKAQSVQSSSSSSDDEEEDDEEDEAESEEEDGGSTAGRAGGRGRGRRGRGVRRAGRRRK